jgi:antagonist of KipI
MTLHILDPGLYTLVVDLGRPACRSLGVPVGGAADRFSLALGNALVGNDPGSAALEITLAGPTLRADCDLGCVVFGSPFPLTSDQRSLKPGTTFTLNAGEQVRIGSTTHGMRAYFCVRGGIQSPTILGSRSGLEPLRTDSALTCRPSKMPSRFVRPRATWMGDPRILRAISGPQAGWFQSDILFAGEYRVSEASNRMGLRLQGAPLNWSEREMTSEPVCPGTVQVTRDGQAIILGVDGQTIGGYPKVAQVITADLDKVGQLRPGEHIRFARVSLEEAELLYRQRQTTIDEWLTRLRVTCRPAYS